MAIKDAIELNPTSKINQPHDKLLKRLLSNIVTTREILEAYLPEEVKNFVDLNHLERQSDSFVDAEHRFLEVDILFKTRCKLTQEDCHIWVLIEQQRQPDAWMPLRLFCYLGVIWDHVRKASKTRGKSAKIPFVYPLVISNASRPYRHSLTLRDMVEPEAAKPLFDKLFNSPTQLIDLAALPDEALRVQLQGGIQALVLLLSLKHIYDKNLSDYLESDLVVLLQALEEQGYRDEVVDLLYYLYSEGNLSHSSKFWPFLHRKFSKEVEEEVMTLRQQDIQQGEQRGLQQGTQKALQETALRMLQSKQFEIETIAKITQLSIAEIESLAKKEN